MSELPETYTRCLSTLRPTSGQPYSRGAQKNLWGGRKVSPVLGFDQPKFHSYRREHADRISISGVQDKLSVKLEKGQLIPTDSDGEYILKPIPSDMGLDYVDQVPANEHLTMQIASQLGGIKTAENGIVYFPDGAPAYIVKRFDRSPVGGERLPQEDFCQLSGRSRASHGESYKYDGSYEELGECLRRYCPSYTIEIEKLYRVILFNYVFCNGDAHLKNFSVSPTEMGDFALSPAYDLLHTKLHVPTETRLALDLFADPDFETASYQAHGFHTDECFSELADRYGMQPARAKRIRDQIALAGEKAQGMIEVSLLSRAAQGIYLEQVQDRMRAVATL